MEVVQDGIAVNAVLPGNTSTAGQLTATGPEFPAETIAKFMPPIGRTGTPEDIASAVLFLASDASAFITRSEEHTSELQSLMRISYAVFCLKKKNNKKKKH